MNLLLLAATVLSITAAPGSGGGGAPYQALDAGDVFVATITRVDDQGATNARPPQVWLEVHEVWRGEAQVARSPAVWSPPFHGIDWGGSEEPLLKKWEVQPLKGPRVGAKFILGGQALLPDKSPAGKKPAVKEAPAYRLYDFVRIPYSEQARKETIAALAALDAARRKSAEEVAAAEKEREDRRGKWRAAFDAATIDRRTQQADAVAIGRIVSSSTFEIESLLKGQPRMSTGGKYYVDLPTEGYDKRILDLVSQRPRCILFLSEKSLTASVSTVAAQLVDPYEGIMPADEQGIAAVRASLEKRPAPPPKPVLVISALDRSEAASLASAAKRDFTVILSHQFSAHGPHVVKHVRQTIPHAAFVVTIDSGSPRRVVAQQIMPESAALLYEANWPAKDAAEPIAGLLKKLVAASQGEKRP